VLPWALCFSCLFLIVGLLVLFNGVAYGASPGSFLYRLTHFASRHR
jgi:hypothetical protein